MFSASAAIASRITFISSVVAFHFSVMPLKGFIVVLLTCGEVLLAPGYLLLELSPTLGHLLLELSLTQSYFFQYAFNAVQAIIAIRHVRSSGSSASPRQFSTCDIRCPASSCRNGGNAEK